MNIYILRHGLAVEPGSSGFTKDSERPLTPKGERKVRKIGKAFEKLELSFDCILSSPYIRARQTARIVADSLDAGKKLDLSEALTPGGSPRKLIEEINGRKPKPENVLIVGHEPYLSELVSNLLSGDVDVAVTMKKGGLCKLTADELRPGQCARLEWLLTPKQMCLMA